MAWISLGLTFGEYIHLLKSVGLCLLPNWTVFSRYFFKHIFSSILVLLYFWNFDDIIIRSFCYSPTGPWTSIFSTHLSLFRLGTCYHSIFQFTDLSFYLFYSVINPFPELFISIIMFLSSIISIWFFFMSYIR